MVWFGFRKSYFSSHTNTRQRGVAILISNSIDFECREEIRDKEGRYIIIKGSIDQNTITLVNVYAPPESDQSFFKFLFDEIATQMEGMCVCGGDFNVVPNHNQDTTSKNRSKKHLSQLLNRACEEMGFFDVWRDLHPLEKDYSHYSATHSVHSRIDYFFMQNEDRDRIKECHIGVADVSDHNALHVTVYLKCRVRSTVWRMNVGILNNDSITGQIKKEIEDYLKDNDNGGTDPNILWDALKAVMRGKLIAITSNLKKARGRQYKSLLTKLKTREQEHKEKPEAKTLQELKDIRYKINELLQQDVEMKARYLKQTYYEIGPKAAKLLARKLRKQQSDRAVPKIQNPTLNQPTFDPKEIENVFRNYYRELYTQTAHVSKGETKSFLDSLDLPSIGTEQNEHISTAITEEEIRKAIGKLKTGKTPGSDGFPPEWYKKFSPELIPLLLTTFNYILEKKCIPPSWKEAIITVIPKAKKNKELCQNYRPISILNVDYKIYISILANRLQTMMPDIIDEDQTGFVRGRQTQDNIRRTLLIINKIRKNKTPSALISLDAEKAFDMVNWEYLYMTLERFGFNEEVIHCIKSIYSNPTARVRVNGSLTDKFTLERGTRQGCCLSPILFAIYIEPLAQMIRQDSSISGIEINNREHRISLFADDVLIYLQRPVDSFDRLMHLLTKYGYYSGYKLNMGKTQTLLFHTTPTGELKECNLPWEAKSLRYLGVNITKNPSDLFKINYEEVNDTIKTDLGRWATYPMDFTDRINAIKMNMLPRLLYLFQSLPVGVPQTQFNKWDKLISRFIWEGKRPRI